MDLQNIFIANMRRIRREKNITQEQLAEKCGTDTAYIGQIETNKRFPSITFIEKIAGALKVESYTLFESESKQYNEINVDELVEKIKNSLLPEIKKEIRDAINEAKNK